MRFFRALSPRYIWRLLPLRRRARCGDLGGAADGEISVHEYRRLEFIRYLIEREVLIR